MDIANLARIFQATLDQNQHEEAEKQLEQVSRNIFYFILRLDIIPMLYT